MCYFSCKAQKNYHVLWFSTWFLLLGKIQDGSQDGNHCWWHHRPPAGPPPLKYTSSCYEDQRLSTKGKIVSKYCNISKTPGRGSLPPLPPYHSGGVNLQVRPGVNKSTDPGCFYKGQEPVIQREQLPRTYVTALSQKKVPFLRGKKVP